MVNFKENEELKTLNHSCAHLMAQAIKHLYPQAKFWVGPVVAEGFYYDVDLGEDVIRDEDIEKIEKEMKKIAKSGKKIMRREVSKAEAMEMFKNDEYKLDLISDLEDGNITVYDQGDFTDLCRGPHVDNVKLCRNFKLIRHSGAYWKGDSKNKVLQRIYGVCFPTAEELEAHLKLLEEAKILQWIGKISYSIYLKLITYYIELLSLRNLQMRLPISNIPNGPLPLPYSVPFDTPIYLLYNQKNNSNSAILGKILDNKGAKDYVCSRCPQAHAGQKCRKGELFHTHTGLR